MLFENWYFTLLRAIPETITLVALGTALVRVPFSVKQLLAAGVGIGIICFFLHQLPIQYGMHIPLGIIVYIIVLSLFLKLNVLKSAAAALLSFIILIFIETLTMLVLINVFGYAEETIIQGPDPTKFLFSLPPLVVLIILAAGAQTWLCFRPRSAK